MKNTASTRNTAISNAPSTVPNRAEVRIPKYPASSTMTAPASDHIHQYDKFGAAVALAGWWLTCVANVNPSWSSTSGQTSTPVSTYPQATRNPAAGCSPRAEYVASEPADGSSLASIAMQAAVSRHAISARATESGSAPPAYAAPVGIDAAIAAPGAMSVIDWNSTSRSPMASRRSPPRRVAVVELVVSSMLAMTIMLTRTFCPEQTRKPSAFCPLRADRALPGGRH